MKDRFTTKIDTSIASAVDYLTQDEVVAIPTETVYGLAANALSEKAVLKIFEAKNRPHFNPLIVHIKDWKEAEKYSSFIHPYIQQLALAFCPGPLTFLVPKKDCIPDLVTAGSPYVALRVPNHNLSLSLLQAVSFPLAAPSANPFGYVSPVSAATLRVQCIQRARLVANEQPAICHGWLCAWLVFARQAIDPFEPQLAHIGGGHTGIECSVSPSRQDGGILCGDRRKDPDAREEWAKYLRFHGGSIPRRALVSRHEDHSSSDRATLD